VAVTDTQAALGAAKSASASGGGWLDLALAVGTAVAGLAVPDLGLAINKIRSQSTAVDRLTTAVQLVASHADAMEAASSDADVTVAKANAQQSQQAAGVFNLISAIRGKA
jgi:hypothetical protein